VNEFGVVTKQELIEQQKAKSMYWNERYESFADSHLSFTRFGAGNLDYPDNHPQLLLPDIQRRVQSFYDAGGRIEIYTGGALKREHKEDLSRALDELQSRKNDIEDIARKQNPGRAFKTSELMDGFTSTISSLERLVEDSPAAPTVDPRTGSIRIHQSLVARTREGHIAGICNVGYRVRDAKIIRQLNEAAKSSYEDAMSIYHDAVEQHQRDTESMRADPWFVEGSEMPTAPRAPREPNYLSLPGKSIPYTGRFDARDETNAYPNIGTVKRLPGTGSALHHALTVLLQPQGLGVNSSYAPAARTFHLNMGRRVDWKAGGGTSIWTPSDIQAISGIKLKNMHIEKVANVKEASYHYSEDDWNPDEVHPVWQTTD